MVISLRNGDCAATRLFFHILASALLIALACLSSQAGDLQTRQLVVTASKQTDAPAFSHYGLALSDNNGDLFFHVGGDVFTNATIMKLAHSSLERTLYKLPSDLQQTKYQFYEFAVSPTGDLWMLANAGPAVSVVAFDSDGQESGRTKLDISLADVNITDLTAFDNDLLFFAGATIGKDAGHPFAALVNGGTGKTIRMWHDVFPAAKDAVPIHAGNASVGDDGNVYLLNESEVVAISPAGEVIKRVKFVKPDQTLIPFLVRASSGYAAVWLRTPPQKDHTLEVSYVVLDLSSGKTLGWYAPPADIRVPAMSFSRNNGFEFLVAKHGKLNLIEADLR
ncbi:MAG TPA: hypothetical protein VFA90_14035 [Terriglobales bacterium]|nr:hypothetical protein [Terriglobales bacterium]